MIEPSPCRVVGSMVSQPYPPCLERVYGFLAVNINDPVSYGPVEELVERVEGFLKNVLRAEGFSLLPTYGGSESTLTALYAMREEWGVERLAVSLAAHESVYKAARVLGLEVLRVPVDEHDRMDVEALRELLEKKGREAGIVATLGTTDLGELDDVEGVVEVAREYGTPVYIDAAFGGLPLALTGRLPVASTADPVIGIGIDLHKFLSPPPAGLLLVKEELLDALSFPAPYMPSGRQYGLLWTRTGFGLAFMDACISILGLKGLESIAEHLYATSLHAHSYAQEKGLHVASTSATPLIAIGVGAKRELVLERLRRRGVLLYPSRHPGTVRVVVKWCHTRGFIEKLVDTIASIVHGSNR